MNNKREYYNRFPIVLRKALLEKRVCFPKELLIEYEDINVYRGVRYNQKKQYIDKTDFLSHVERDNPSVPYDPDNISGYGCSCFSDLDELHMITKFPTKNKVIAKGTLREQYGPCVLEKGSSHVNIFLYEGVDMSHEFEVIEKWEKNGFV